MKANPTLFESGIHERGFKDRGITPRWFMKRLQQEFDFDFDPCPENWDKSFNGLEIEWKNRNYCNPPYSEKKKWITKAVQEQRKGRTTVMFLPVDTSTIWFHDLILPNAEIRWIKGRVKSDDGKIPFFASMLAIFWGLPIDQ